MNIYKLITNILIVICCSLFFACSKEFLEAKPNKDIVVPKSVKDIQAILDNYSIQNRNPGVTFIGNDDYYTIESAWNNYNPWEQRLYIWAEKPFEIAETTIFDWIFGYESIFEANVCLEQLALLPPSDSVDVRRLKGTALFFRAYNYYGLSELFIPPFSERDNDEKGYLPLRTLPDINLKVPFATAKEIYKLIVDDLEEAIELLPEVTEYRTRPTKWSAHAMLARFYLAAEEYELAHFHAEKVLTSPLYQLLNYNDLDLNNSYPIPPLSSEVIIHSELLHVSFNGSNLSMVDSVLYLSYDDNDLRKQTFFQPQAGGWPHFQGSYTGGFRFFGGIALDEIYLILAECKVRLGQIPEGLDVLNELVEKRWLDGTFTPLAAANESEALGHVLEHRQKELVFRGTRWSDLRRLNKDPRFAKTLVRVMAGQTYSLEPNSPRYVLPTPPREPELEN